MYGKVGFSLRRVSVLAIFGVFPFAVCFVVYLLYVCVIIHLTPITHERKPPPQSVAPLSIALDLDGKSAEEVFVVMADVLKDIKNYLLECTPDTDEGLQFAWRSALTVFDPETVKAQTNQLESGIANQLIWDENGLKVLQMLTESE